MVWDMHTVYFWHWYILLKYSKDWRKNYYIYSSVGACTLDRCCINSSSTKAYVCVWWHTLKTQEIPRKGFSPIMILPNSIQDSINQLPDFEENEWWMKNKLAFLRVLSVGKKLLAAFCGLFSLSLSFLCPPPPGDKWNDRSIFLEGSNMFFFSLFD